MAMLVVERPPDRPAWVREAVGIVAGLLDEERERLLARVAAASDAELTRGSADEWGIGQVAAHLLFIERAVALIALRLAQDREVAGPLGQVRFDGGAPSRDEIAALAEKARAAVERLRAEFPAEPSARVAPNPYLAEQNWWGWLLTLPLHYAAHLGALERGERSTL